jgi:phage tail-like protein
MKRATLFLILSFVIFSFMGMAQNLRYSVEWSGNRVVFTTVSGLDQPVQQPAYRKSTLSISGNDAKQTVCIYQKNILLKGGNCMLDNGLYKWFGTFSQATQEKRDLTVKLLNSKGEPVKTWKVRQATPVKVVGPTLNAKGTDVAIETVVLAYEGIETE